MDETSPTSPNWDVIHTEFVCGNDTIAKLAEKYGVTENAMTGRVFRGKWGIERKEIQARARAEANAEIVHRMAQEINKSAALDISIAVGLKRQIMRHIDKADAIMGLDPENKQVIGMEAPVIRQLASAAEHVQRIGKLAVGEATSITETNAAVQVETPDYENLPPEEIDKLIAAREILDRLQGVPNQ